jgi:hypothetical protein
MIKKSQSDMSTASRTSVAVATGPRQQQSRMKNHAFHVIIELLAGQRADHGGHVSQGSETMPFGKWISTLNYFQPGGATERDPRVPAPPCPTAPLGTRCSRINEPRKRQAVVLVAFETACWESFEAAFWAERAVQPVLPLGRRRHLAS